MGRFYVCPKSGLRKGAWTPEEDHLLAAYIKRYGHCNWGEIPKKAGLSRCGKSCRLRWLNYLRPNIKRGNYTLEEDELIIKLHEKLGNKWSVIASNLPRRTDNDIKNHWHCDLKRRIKQSETVEDKKRHNDMEREITCEQSSVTPLSMESSSSLPLPLPPANSVDFSWSKLKSPISPQAIWEFDSNFWGEGYQMNDLYLPGDPSVPSWPSVVWETTNKMDTVTSPFMETSDFPQPPPPISSDFPLGFDANIWSEPFKIDNMFMQRQPIAVSSPLGEISYPYNLYNDYDMDIFFNY